MKEKRKFKIEPWMTGRDALWEATRIATVYHMRKLTAKNSLSPDDWHDCFQEIQIAAVRFFMRNMIGEKRYNREYTFFNNCFAAVWSVAGRTFYSFCRGVCKRPEQMDDRIEYSAMPRYINKDEPAAAQKNLRTLINKSKSIRFKGNEAREDAWTYLDYCEEFGIEPDKECPLYKKWFGKPWRNKY